MDDSKSQGPDQGQGHGQSSAQAPFQTYAIPGPLQASLSGNMVCAAIMTSEPGSDGTSMTFHSGGWAACGCETCSLTNAAFFLHQAIQIARGHGLSFDAIMALAEGFDKSSSGMRTLSPHSN